MVDNSSAFRYDDDVPLVVPEVNGALLDARPTLVANPNCSTIAIVVALAPLGAGRGLERVVVATYQSVSGGGIDALDELERGVRAGLDGAPPARATACAPFAFNVVPHIDRFEDNGYTREEMKIVWETRKILGLPELPVTATAVRVPVRVGHSAAVNADAFARRSIPTEARGCGARSPGVEVVDDPAARRYPTPLEAAGRDAVLWAARVATCRSRAGSTLFLAPTTCARARRSTRSRSPSTLSRAARVAHDRDAAGAAPEPSLVADAHSRRAARGAGRPSGAPLVLAVGWRPRSPESPCARARRRAGAERARAGSGARLFGATALAAQRAVPSPGPGADSAGMRRCRGARPARALGVAAAVRLVATASRRSAAPRAHPARAAPIAARAASAPRPLGARAGAGARESRAIARRRAQRFSAAVQAEARRIAAAWALRAGRRAARGSGERLARRAPRACRRWSRRSSAPSAWRWRSRRGTGARRRAAPRGGARVTGRLAGRRASLGVARMARWA